MKGQEGTKEEVVIRSVNAAEKTWKVNSPDECTREFMDNTQSAVGHYVSGQLFGILKLTVYL